MPYWLRRRFDSLPRARRPGRRYRRVRCSHSGIVRRRLYLLRSRRDDPRAGLSSWSRGELVAIAWRHSVECSPSASCAAIVDTTVGQRCPTLRASWNVAHASWSQSTAVVQPTARSRGRSHSPRPRAHHSSPSALRAAPHSKSVISGIGHATPFHSGALPSLPRNCRRPRVSATPRQSKWRATDYGASWSASRSTQTGRLGVGDSTSLRGAASGEAGDHAQDRCEPQTSRSTATSSPRCGQYVVTSQSRPAHPTLFDAPTISPICLLLSRGVAFSTGLAKPLAGQPAM